MNPEILQPGDILHCTGSRWLSKVIRWITKSKFSHTALFILVNGDPFIIDAQKDGVQVRSWDNWMKDFGYKMNVSRPSMEYQIGIESYIEIALSKVGTTAYDFESLLVKQPIELITGKWKKKRSEDGKMYCSEFVMWVYSVDTYYRMSPEDAHQWCEANGFKTIFKQL